MHDVVVSQRDIGDKADWTDIGSVATGLVLGRKQNVGAGLREAAPGILQDVAFDQNSLPLLQLKIVLHGKSCSDETLVERIPGERLEQMVQPDLDITRNDFRIRTAEHNVLTGGFH